MSTFFGQSRRLGPHRLALILMPLWLFLAVALNSAGAVAQSAPISPETYRIAPEDVISVVVRDVAEASGDYLVRKDGMITVPLAGELRVAGLTVREVEQLVTQRLRGELRDPQVTVNLRSATARRIYVLGAVRTSGILDWKPGWRLSEVVAASSGLVNTPERTRALIFRVGQPNRVIPMDQILVRGDDSANLLVEPGDVINFQSDILLRVQVVGKVARQGLVEVLQGQGAVEALAAAGGHASDAKLTSAKILRRGTEIKVDLYSAVVLGDPSTNIPIEEGDTLIIPSQLARVSIIGAVGRPGPMQIPDGRTLTLSEAVSLAGGPTQGAKIDGVTLVRMDESKRLVSTNFDLRATLRGQGKPGSDPTLQDGDIIYVSTSGRPRAGDIGNVLGLLAWPLRFFPF